MKSLDIAALRKAIRGQNIEWRVANKPLHVVAALDDIHQIAYIITAYEPSLEVFEKDYKTRRNP